MRAACPFFLATAILCLVAGTSSSQEVKTAGHPHVVADRQTRISFTIEDIDLDKRVLKLKNPKGEITEIAVSDKVNNLDRLRKGDPLQARYHETITLDHVTDGAAKPRSEEKWTLESTKPGADLGAVASTRITTIATVAAVDRQKPSVTLLIPDSSTASYILADPSMLGEVKVGDLMQVVETKVMVFSAEIRRRN